jgi:hypothetical protein
MDFWKKRAYNSIYLDPIHSAGQPSRLQFALRNPKLEELRDHPLIELIDLRVTPKSQKVPATIIADHYEVSPAILQIREFNWRGVVLRHIVEPPLAVSPGTLAQMITATSRPSRPMLLNASPRVAVAPG